MTRRAPRAAADRWLISYADLMTLLLAFFASVYALSDVNAEKLKPAARAVRLALGQPEAPAAPGPLPEVAPPVRVVHAPRHDPPSGTTVSDHLQRVLAGEIAGGRARVTTSRADIVLSLPEAATFESGRAELSDGARQVVARLAEVLVDTGLEARVEGHTDDVPISSLRYSSNWELSTARASGVVAALVGRGVNPARLSAAGYGEFHPKVPNVSPASRAQNRRVDIVLIGGALDGGGPGDAPAPAGDGQP